MIKKSIIIALAVFLVGTVSVGAYDVYQGNSSLNLPDFSLGQANQNQGWGQGQQQGRGQGQSQGQEQGQGRGYGDGSGIPQAMANAEWVTLTGSIVSIDQRGMTVDTVEMGQLNLEMGPPWFAGEQGITFNPGDPVTIVGFEGEDSLFQAGQITNDTTGETLLLRDPNGRPLWAGRGQN